MDVGDNMIHIQPVASFHLLAYEAVIFHLWENPEQEMVLHLVQATVGAFLPPDFYHPINSMVPKTFVAD